VNAISQAHFALVLSNHIVIALSSKGGDHRRFSFAKHQHNHHQRKSVLHLLPHEESFASVELLYKSRNKQA
jgi:hypothetical protein